MLNLLVKNHKISPFSSLVGLQVCSNDCGWPKIVIKVVKATAGHTLAPPLRLVVDKMSPSTLQELLLCVAFDEQKQYFQHQLVVMWIIYKR